MQEVSLEYVSVRYGDVAALSDVSLEIGPGERLAVIGTSGAGKSTLFRALTRSVVLAHGRVLVGGRALYARSKQGLKDVRRRIGTIHQAYNLVPQLSAGVNASLGQVAGMGHLETLRTFFTGPDAGLSERTRAALGGSAWETELMYGRPTSPAASSSGWRSPDCRFSGQT